MMFPNDHPELKLRGQAKGIEQVLRERGLWRDLRSDGFAFLLQCPVGNNCIGCDPTIEGGCCTRSLLAQQPDFTARLEEEVQARNHNVIFHLKFHCELNFIGRFWCAAKYYARENSLEKLRETTPAALDSVSSVSTNRCYYRCLRITPTYRDGHMEQESLQRQYRLVVDKSKW
jgi:hypothetical protein